MDAPQWEKKLGRVLIYPATWMNLKGFRLSEQRQF